MSEDVSSAVIEDDDSSRRRRKDRLQKLVHDFLGCRRRVFEHAAFAGFDVRCATLGLLPLGSYKQGLVTVREPDKAFYLDSIDYYS